LQQSNGSNEVGEFADSLTPVIRIVIANISARLIDAMSLEWRAW